MPYVGSGTTACRPSSIAWRSASVSGARSPGTASTCRRRRASALRPDGPARPSGGSSGRSGRCRGPRPSDDVVEDGADTHSFRKIPSPTLKSSCWAKVSVAEKWENALRVAAWREVAAPPGDSSSLSGAEKSVGGARRVAWSTGLSAGSSGLWAPSAPASTDRPAARVTSTPAAAPGAGQATSERHRSPPVLPLRRLHREPRLLLLFLQDRVRLVQAVGALELDRLELERGDDPLGTSSSGRRDRR